MNDTNTESKQTSNYSYISIGQNNVDPKTLTEMALQLRHTERQIDNLKKDRDEWKQVAEELYNYYFLGTGISKCIKAYETKAGLNNE
jgi:predicted HTH transcriptional regulator